MNNKAQLDNLLNLARSSFESKNYSQAEEFCNQVLAMDSQHYEAWKLKGEAINYQIGAKNQRIAEVYNCMMTAYRVCDEADKLVNRYEILSTLKTCFEGEVDFWLKQFEAARQKAKQDAKKEKERLEKIAKYWEAHPEEKARLEEEKAQLKERLDALNKRIAEIDKELTKDR